MPASGDWLPFEQARLVVVSQNFKRSQDFKDWSARPENIPYSPQNAYQQEWVGWSHFLGIGPRLDASRKDRTQFLSFDEARLIVVSQNFKRSQDFKDWSDRPPNIPSNPRTAYTQDWLGWAYFLGIGSASVTSQLQ